MKMMSWREFVTFYHRYGRMPQQINPPNKILNAKQLERGYEKYKKSIDKTEKRRQRWIETIRERGPAKGRDEGFDAVREQVFLRDGNRCRLLEILNGEEKQDLVRRAGRLIHMVDAAHVISRASSPALKYDPENVVCLNRYSHSMIDSFKHPIYGNPISREEKRSWWIRIIGHENYDKLLRKRGENESQRKRE